MAETISDYIENLKQTRLQVSQRLRQITKSPKPSYNVNGQQVSWSEYLDKLMNTLKELDERIAAGEVDDTPWEVDIQAFT